MLQAKERSDAVSIRTLREERDALLAQVQDLLHATQVAQQLESEVAHLRRELETVRRSSPRYKEKEKKEDEKYCQRSSE